MKKLKARITELESENKTLTHTNKNLLIAMEKLKQAIYRKEAMLESANLQIDILDHNLRSLERKHETL